MDIAQYRWNPSTQWGASRSFMADADWLLVFADTPFFQTPACFALLRERFPLAQILGCSTSGNIMGTELSDDDMVVTAIRLAGGYVRLLSVEAGHDMAQATQALISQLQDGGLRHAIVLADGQFVVDGSAMVSNVNHPGVTVTGGMAGDGVRFGDTWVMANAPARRGIVAVLGLYGAQTLTSVSVGGWQAFGSERRVSAASGNTVFEIDGQPALALYKKYLGALAHDLPGSGLRFPMGFYARPGAPVLVRTLLGVDEATQSLRFAGDVPQHALCRLMRSQLDDLIDSASLAAASLADGSAGRQGLCLAVSCVARRLVLGQMAEEELEMVQEQLGLDTVLTGFYSYGELAPLGGSSECGMHNQTLVLSVLHD